MMANRLRTAAALALAFPGLALAEVHTQTGWAAWNNTHALGGPWSLATDLQVRSADGWERVRNVVVRPSLAYAFNSRLTASLGYMFNRTFSPGAPDTSEHRVWQQLVASQPLPRAQLTHRLRLEQRFIGRAGQPDVEAIRLRYQLRAQVPLRAAPSAFTRGTYLATHVEWMGHLSGEGQLNGRTFDQLRAYMGFGWRLSRRAELELGYQQQHLNGRTVDTRNHIILFSANTRF